MKTDQLFKDSVNFLDYAKDRLSEKDFTAATSLLSSALSSIHSLHTYALVMSGKNQNGNQQTFGDLQCKEEHSPKS